MKVILNITMVFGVLFCASIGLFSQEKDLETIGQEIWSDNKFTDEIPDDWKNESAVIIYQKIYNEYAKIAMSGKLQHLYISRRRIKLNDKAAINKFSIFEYDPIEISKKGAESVVQIKVIKPNGKEEIIKDDNAEDITSNGEVVRKKLAIPNLSPGDIIDFYQIDKTVYKKVGNYFEFPIEYTTLASEYNVLNQVIDFKVLRKCHIAYKSMNGAPEFEKIGGEEADFFNYVLKDKNREKYKGITWANRIGELPSIKFKVIFAAGEHAAQEQNFHNESLVLNNVSKEDVLEISKKVIGKTIPSFISNEIYLKVNKVAVTDLKKNMSLTREDQVKSFFQRSLLSLYSSTYKYRVKALYSDKAPLKSEIVMYYPLMAYCQKNNLPFSIVLTPNKYRSKIENLISLEELTPMLKVNVDGQDLFLYYDIAYYAPGEFPYAFQDVESYELKTAKTYKEWKLGTCTTPVLADNYESNSFTVKPDFEENNIRMENMSELSGYIKSSKLREIKFNTSELYDLYASSPSKKATSFSDGRKSKFTIATNTYSNEFKVYDNDFERMGNSFNESTMLYNEYMVLEDKIKQATDKVFLVNLYDVVSDQMHIDQEERKDRDVNIQMTAPRYYENNIVFKKVDGYEITNAKDLNLKFENSIGVFTAEIEETDDGYLLKSKKTYKKAFFDKSKWSEVVKFTDVVYDYFHKKVSYVKN